MLPARQLTIAEITRVLKRCGLIGITLPASKKEPSKRQEEIEPGTFVPMDGPEKGLPHHYFKKYEIADLLADFRILDLHTDEINHFCLVAQKVSQIHLVPFRTKVIGLRPICSTV